MKSTPVVGDSPSKASTFLISLESEAVNRSAVFEELKKLELGPIQVIKAFDGRAQLQFDDARLEPFLGTLGCLISHLSIYVYCKKNRIQRALIFEDDAKVKHWKIAKQAIFDGESSDFDICCYCSKSTDKRFINCHAYSMSLVAMNVSLTTLDSIIQSPVNIHIDRLIEYCRRLYALSYCSLRHSTIVQDKSLPFTTKWGAPDFVTLRELETVKQKLISNPLQISTVMRSEG